MTMLSGKNNAHNYNPFLVYCRELAPGTVSFTGDRAQGDDSKHDSHYSKNFSVLYVLRKHQQHINIQWHHLRCYFWLIDHPILGQVATLRSFQLESILECPALDVRQLVRNKRRKEYDSPIT